MSGDVISVGTIRRCRRAPGAAGVIGSSSFGHGQPEVLTTTDAIPGAKWWIAATGEDGTIFVAYDALHHHTSKELIALLEAIGRKHPAALVLSEPVDPRLTGGVTSKPRGGMSISWSHDYLAYLARCHYRIVCRREIPNVYPLVPAHNHQLIAALPDRAEP